ncbi:hypothetical protein ZEAMMB73_Zm00001d021538, partial [Zea mays]
MAVVEACDPARIDISSKTAASSERTTQLISGGRHAATPPLPSSCSPPTPASRSSSTVSPSPPSLHLASRARTKLRTFLLKPFKLITVFLHETSHALACKLTCGD